MRQAHHLLYRKFELRQQRFHSTYFRPFQHREFSPLRGELFKQTETLERTLFLLACAPTKAYNSATRLVTPEAKHTQTVW